MVWCCSRTWKNHHQKQNINFEFHCTKNWGEKDVHGKETHRMEWKTVGRKNKTVRTKLNRMKVKKANIRKGRHRTRKGGQTVDRSGDFKSDEVHKVTSSVLLLFQTHS
jgi:hypothetical protein